MGFVTDTVMRLSSLVRATCTAYLTFLDVITHIFGKVYRLQSWSLHDVLCHPDTSCASDLVIFLGAVFFNSPSR